MLKYSFYICIKIDKKERWEKIDRREDSSKWMSFYAGGGAAALGSFSPPPAGAAAPAAGFAISKSLLRSGSSLSNLNIYIYIYKL